jgi:large subunit ribosomal protein L31
MKAGIHPQYNNNVQVTCACGATFITGSTKDGIKVEICSSCHPFFTGAQRFVDTVGKVQKFQDQQKLAASKQAVLANKKKAKEEKEQNRPRTLREMLQGSK